MHINWSSVARIGLGIAGALIPQVHTIEEVAKAIPSLKGRDKENAAVLLAQDAMEVAEEVTGKELLSDPQVDAAVRTFVQGYVTLQNAVSAAKALKAGKPAPVH